jgi:hypothetical protein
VTWGIWNFVLVHFEMVLVSVQDSAWFAPNISLALKSFWTHLMVTLGDETQVEASFGPFGDSANLDAR